MSERATKRSHTEEPTRAEPSAAPSVSPPLLAVDDPRRYAGCLLRSLAGGKRCGRYQPTFSGYPDGGEFRAVGLLGGKLRDS